MVSHRTNNTSEDRQLQERKRREYRRDYTDPIKHYVRREAWIPAAQARQQKVQGESRQYLKYFTLCAEEAIDVRLFGIIENLIEFNEREYPGVVFCEYIAETYELIAANLGRTVGILISFEDLVLNKNNEKSQIFYSRLPFDIYNLDFTSACFPRSEPPFSSTLKAIVTLIEVLGNLPDQQGFDLFLTFRAQRSEENKNAINALKRNIRDNRRQYSWFDAAFIQRYNVDVGQLLRTKYYEFLLLALPKLLGRFGKDAGFRVTCPYRFCYPRPSLQDTDYHIITFVLSFDWEGKDTELRQTVLQPVPRQEVATEAYLAMMRQIVEQNVTNVAATRFSHEQYKQEVQILLEMARNP